ncbi:MAG: toxin co-regulated pilus biosynthesis Q family protein [Pseudomonadota bacterium]
MKNLRLHFAFLLTLFTCAQSMAQIIGIKPLQHSSRSNDVLAMSIQPLSSNVQPADALPILKTWTLQAGKTSGENLKAWAATANWTVIWNHPQDWNVPASTLFYGEFADAAEEVIKTLAANGALIRANINEGNNTIVVSGPGVKQQ